MSSHTNILNIINSIKTTPHTTLTLNNFTIHNLTSIIKYLIYKKVNKLTLQYHKNVSTENFKKLQSNLKTYYISYMQKIQIEITNIPENNLIELLGTRGYLNYCEQNSKIPQYTKHQEKETEKIDKYKHLKKYDTFNILTQNYTNIPFSKFEFPIENNTDRFVFHFHIYSQNSQKQILDLFKKLQIPYQHLNIIQNIKINQDLFYFAIGFSYQNNKLKRTTLYSWFANQKIKNFDNLQHFFISKHQLQINQELKNISFYGYDIYDDKHEEIKIYDETHKFNQTLNPSELSQTLQNKPCTKTIKYRNKTKINTKYEFEINKYFTSEETKILKKYNLYKENTRLLAIYIQNQNIIKTIFYEL